jgi:RND family efflux transporter MFP subunit
MASAILALGWLKMHGAGRGALPAPAIPNVNVAAPLSRDITEWDDYIGRFRASQSVDVRSRVPGQITGIHFTDGQMVKKGQLLFTIDRRRFQAAQDTARGDIEAARANLALARAQLVRAQKLSGDSALSTDTLDQLRANEQASQGALSSAQGRLRARDLDLEFAEVHAPISGRISDRRVDTGNQVTGTEGADGTLLTTIDAIDPIYFDFDASEALFLKAQRTWQSTGEPAKVEIRLQNETAYCWKGQLDFIDSGLDPRAGTIRGRAILPNPSGLLRSGLFGNMRLAAGYTARALLVPDAAIRTDQARQIVLVVDDKNFVSAKEVEAGPLVDGLRVIRSGLSANERVLVDGAGIVPGVAVNPHETAITLQPSAPIVADQLPASAEATIAQ